MKTLPQINLAEIPEEKLLETRICDLPVSIENTWLAECVKELHKELTANEIPFIPECYLADEWLTPDKEPVVGIPFFLADPALIRLEKKMMLEAEGDTRQWCMKLLRHETGHALNYAYRLYRRKKWREIFGPFSKDYPDTYRFRPYSRNFVRHLEDYYAQYHPDEDFAETFSVWLTPELNWKEQYKGWKALKKLQYVDEVMNSLKGKAPPVKTGKKYWQASKMKTRLKNYYRKKRRFHAEDFPDFHDTNLRKIFTLEKEENNQRADTVIRKHRKTLLESSSIWTGEKKYIVGDLIQKIIKRCRELRLYTREDETASIMRVCTYINTLVMNYQHTGRYRTGK